MPFAGFLVTLCFLCLQILVAQNPPPAKLREPNAVAALDNLSAATGWIPSQLPTDAIVKGQFIRLLDGVERTFPATFKIKGPHQFKMTAESGLISVVNDKKAVIKSPNETRKVPAHSAYAKRPTVLPFFSEIASAIAGSSDLSLLEAEEVSSDLCDKLLISSPGVETKRDGGVRLDQLTIWISKTSHMLRQVSFIQPTDTNMTASLERKVVFSDYRAVNGIAVPFLSEEYLAGRPLFKFKTETVEFNMGVDLSEFAIPEQTEASK